MSVYRPQTGEELAAIILAAHGEGRTLELRGGGTKAAFGAPREAGIVDLRRLSGIVDYDPAELVLTVKAGTPLADVQALVAERGQMLAFDPWEAGVLYGGAAAGATIGGTIAAGIAGPLRISGGGARDHLLGFTAVSGRGERFVAGAKVVKNVTGFDLSKLMSGSWGRLAALTELTLKVLPRPVMEITLAVHGLADAAAIEAMSAAMGSAAEVAAAAHLPARIGEAGPLTLFRLRGFEQSVVARRLDLEGVLAPWGGAEFRRDGDRLLSDVRTVAPLAESATLWRMVVPPSRAAAAVAALPRELPRLFDWAGNLLWIGGIEDYAAVRSAAAAAGGHATLVRASDAMRAHVSAFHPPARAVTALEMRVRRAFDPLGVFETGRFQAPKNAN